MGWWLLLCFWGVARIDITVAAFDAADGTRQGHDSESVIWYVCFRLDSHGEYPILNLDRCQVESFHRRNDTGSAVCMTKPTVNEIDRFDHGDCLSTDEDPAAIWEDTDNAGLPFREDGIRVIFTTRQDTNTSRVSILIGTTSSGLRLILCFVATIFDSIRATGHNQTRWKECRRGALGTQWRKCGRFIRVSSSIAQFTEVGQTLLINTRVRRKGIRGSFY